MADNVYFAIKPGKDAASVLLEKIDSWSMLINSTGYLDKLKASWRAYFGAYYTDASNGHQITFGGEQGELTQFPVNHYANLASHIITMTTSTRPAMDARAMNSDMKSIAQAKLANGILDYYLREKNLEQFLKQAVEHAVVMGAGFISLGWNATAGEIYDYMLDDETGQEDPNRPIYEGDIEFRNHSPFDVVMDGTKENQQHDWYIIRSWKNKYDLAAKYPEFSDKLLNLQTKSDIDRYTFGIKTLANEETDDVPIYEFYHKKTEAVPNGRYMLFCEDSVVLQDIGLPYRVLPVFRISYREFLGTPYGYTSMFDCLPLQEQLNALYSAVATNQNTSAVQNFWTKPNSGLIVSQLAGGMNLIESMEKPEVLELCSTPKEVFDFINIIKQDMETITGVNSVARGDPQASLRTGAALALVQSQALQFISGLQESYVELIENVGTSIIRILQDYAKTPRLVAIVGKNNKTLLEQFSADDISNICRVYVDVGNPLAKCLAKDTPVLMFNGSVKMVQDINVGDLVMGPDSSPRTVSHVNNGQEVMYEITSKDSTRGVKYGCNESHILTLKYCSDDYRYDAKKGDILDISVGEYLKLTERQKRLLQGFTTGVEFEKKNTPIPAYILGLWLGDGNSRTTSITSMDEEIVTTWTNYAHSIGMQVRVEENKQPNKSKNYHITSGQQNGKPDRNPFMNDLRELELIENKHIPFNYLNTTRTERLELLAGLLDTDGYRIDETFIITQKNERLAEDISRLAKSLGFRVSTRKVKARATNSTTHVASEYTNTSIGGDTWEIPTKLPRKQAKEKEKARDPLNYGINVECKGVGTYYGFTLEEEPHFLLGDFTVTHNTIAGRMELAQNMMQYGGLSDPRQIYQVMSTGTIEDMDDDVLSQLNLIKSENEALMDGQTPPTLMTDQHKEHIDNHVKCLNDPELRKDTGLVQRVTAHIQQHIQLLQTTDPNLLQLLGQQPLPPPPQPGPPQGAPGPGGPPGAPPQNGPMAQPPGGQQGLQLPPGQNHLMGPGLPPHGQRLPHTPQAPPNLVKPPMPQG